MRMRSWVTAVIVTLTIGGALFAWDSHLRWELYQKYGPAPGLTIGHDGWGPTYCHYIIAVNPPAHYTWSGKMWEDDDLPWADVVITFSDGSTLRHNHTGPVRVGDRLCPIDPERGVAYTYGPTGAALWTEN